MEMSKHSVVVIGGGAAGMAAAIAAARTGAKVLIAEKSNRLGKKILATGNGRCNLSNMSIGSNDAENSALFDQNAHHSQHAQHAHSTQHSQHTHNTHHTQHTHNTQNAYNAYHNNEFAAPTLKRYRCTAIREFFAGLGLLTTTDERGWVFPSSKWANSVLDVLVAEVRRLDIKCLFEADIRSIEIRKAGGYGLVFGAGSILHADTLIIATGTSNITNKLAGFTHEKIQPILAPLVVEPTEKASLKSLDGVRCVCAATLYRTTPKKAQAAELESLEQNQLEQEYPPAFSPLASERGEVLFRPYGVSGIAIFNLSRHAQKGDTLVLDLLAEQSLYDLEHFFAQRLEAHGTLPVEQLLTGTVHTRLAAAVLKKAGLKPTQPATTENIPTLAANLKTFTLPLTGETKEEQAQVMRGGLAVEGFNPDTLCSRAYSGIFAAGEALDVDGPCGGYNLHWAWASGLVAGEQAAHFALQ
jgi:predicted Rossmann fold flavoprotein